MTKLDEAQWFDLFVCVLRHDDRRDHLVVAACDVRQTPRARRRYKDCIEELPSIPAGRRRSPGMSAWFAGEHAALIGVFFASQCSLVSETKSVGNGGMSFPVPLMWSRPITFNANQPVPKLRVVAERSASQRATHLERIGNFGGAVASSRIAERKTRRRLARCGPAVSVEAQSARCSALTKP